jgi:hypothetical protein
MKESNTMKSRILLASGLFGMALVFFPTAYGQPQLPTPKAPAPDKGKPKPTGTATGGVQNIINSKLMIYTRNGDATTNTNISGEFGSQLATSATAGSEFTLLWSRTKPGKIERGLVYIRKAGTHGISLLKLATATLQPQSTEVNIPISLPTLTADTYELNVVGDTGSSTKVTINYGGKGPDVVTKPSGPAPPTSNSSSIHIASAKFTPMVGSPGSPGYKRAKLILNIRSAETTTISKIDVEVLSEAWTNPGLLTSSNSKNSPIVLFSKKWTAPGGAYQIVKDKDNYITVSLRRNSTNDVDAGEGGPGFYSPGDWGYAFTQTTTATFRWKVDGKVSGSALQSPMSQWQWGAQ